MPQTTVAVEPPAAELTAEEIGEQVAGLFRSSVLGSGQKSCLGLTLFNEFGASRVAAAIASGSPRDDTEFVDAIIAAANNCNIDPSAVLG